MGLFSSIAENLGGLVELVTYPAAMVYHGPISNAISNMEHVITEAQHEQDLKRIERDYSGKMSLKQEILDKLEHEINCLDSKGIQSWLENLSEQKFDGEIFVAIITILVKYDLTAESLQEKYNKEMKDKICEIINDAEARGINIEKTFAAVSEKLSKL